PPEHDSRGHSVFPFPLPSSAFSPNGAKCLSPFEFVEERIATLHVMQAAAEGLEMASEQAPIELRRTGVHADVGARPIAYIAEVAGGDGLQVKKTSAHRGHV